MRWLTICLLSLLFVCGTATAETKAEPRIIKVLPQYLDLKGRSSLAPSLYERDAYQARLRGNAKERSAIRFDVQWKEGKSTLQKPLIKIEVRGVKGNATHLATIEQAADKKGWFSNWTSPTLAGKEYRDLGEMVAWRATLWDGDRQVSEQKSFLW